MFLILQVSESSLFNHSGKHFLKHYGKFYGLFDSFFVDDQTYPPDVINFATKNISDQYLVRNYSSYSNWELLASIDADQKYVNYADRYRPSETKLVRYNNRFRFGTGISDRFHSIFFNKDPWIDKDSSVMFGTFPPDSKKISNSYCRFITPFHIDVVVEYYRSMNMCKIPLVIKEKLTEDTDHISLHLIQKSSDGEKVLLSNITIHRLHPLDRRFFNVSICTMINGIYNLGMVEWLVHNLALGVEHFYLFDNRKLYLDGNTPDGSLGIENSVLKPFLDANLITLIYYPFCPDKEREWNTIQFSSIEVFLNQFGHYSKWVGLYDTDEFFVASPNMVESFLIHRRNDGSINLIMDLLNTLENSTTAKRIHRRDPAGI